MKTLPRPAPGLLTVLAGTVLLGLAACETTVDVELEAHDPRLVVNGLFRADSLWEIELRRSVSPSETAALDSGLSEERLREATVTIREHGGATDTLHLAEDGSPDDWYFRSRTRRPRAGHTYTLRAQVPGFAPVEATSRVPRPLPFETSTEALAGDDDAFAVRLADPGGRADYYALSLYRRATRTYTNEDSTYTRSYLNEWAFESGDPLLLNGTLDCAVISEGPPRYETALFDDASFDGQTREIVAAARLNPSPNEGQTNEYLAILYVLAEPYFRFQASLENPCDFNNPFAEPEEVYSNVEGGFGIFAGSSQWRETVYRQPDRREAGARR